MHRTLPVSVDEDIIDLAESFLESRRGQVERARTAVTSRDLQCLNRIGHELKGTAGSYGFHALSAIGERIETAADDGDIVGCEEAIEQMDDFLARVTIIPG